MDAIEVTSLQSEVFETSSLLYVFCIDSAIKMPFEAINLPHVTYKTVMGHVSFPNELNNRRIGLFPDSEKLSHLREFSSPLVINVKSSCSVTILDDDGSVIERTLIYDWEVEHHLTASALALRPRDLSKEPNSIPTLPWLNVTRTTCNCNLFPRSGKVLISTNDAHEIVNQNDNDDNEDDSDEHDGQVVDIIITPAPTTSSQPAGTARTTPEYAEKFKLKGSSYHTDFQTALRKCQTLLRAKTAVVCQLNIEPVNIKDENAVVVQSWLDDQWCSLWYVPGKKCHKVLSAIQESQITEIKLTRVYREISVNEGVYYLYGDVVLLKQGRWLPDTKGYKYNDPASKKYFS